MFEIVRQGNLTLLNSEVCFCVLQPRQHQELGCAHPNSSVKVIQQNTKLETSCCDIDKKIYYHGHSLSVSLFLFQAKGNYIGEQKHIVVEKQKSYLNIKNMSLNEAWCWSAESEVNCRFLYLQLCVCVCVDNRLRNSLYPRNVYKYFMREVCAF